MEQNIYLDKERLENSKLTTKALGESLEIDSLKEKVVELNKKQMEPGFWDDNESAQKVIRETNSYQRKIDQYDKLNELITDAEDLITLMEIEEDYSSYSDFQGIVDEIEKEAAEFKLNTLLNGEYDSHDAILSIHAGAGGTEAQDWASMLLRMYTRYAENKGFKVETLDLLKEDEAGIKSVTLKISGDNAYGYLKGEKGVHRLVRISPFDSNKRRHTSFSSVDVFPEIDDDTEVEIKDEELKIDTYRSSGAGGQHVNTTDSAVRITHIPTGIVVQCQNERSQIQNREKAMNMLKAKLVALAEEEKKEKIEDLQGNYSQIAWGSQIRSYVFQPYTMVKDHRTNVDVGDVEKVMDGDLDTFINAYLQDKVNMAKDVIIALDFSSGDKALDFLKDFKYEEVYVKVGMELFYKEGPSIVREIKKLGHKIFLDLKIHDIPNTCKGATNSLIALDVDMINYHIAGGKKMLSDASEIVKNEKSDLITLGVTMLTSTDEEVMHKR